MELLLFQNKVAQFVAKHRLETSVETRVLDLTSEVGELAKEVLKGSRYGKEPFRPSEGWDDEVADVLFSLICIANSTGVNLEAALHGALEKYAKRLSARGDAGSGR